MTRIVVPPERIQEVSQQFAQASMLTSSMISNLNGQILSLQSRWAGITQERFFQEFQVARGQMESFTTSVASIGTELRSIAVKFAETDQTAGNGIHTDGNSQGQNPKETLSNLFNQGENAWSTANGIRGNLALAGTGMYSLLASTLVLTKTVDFKRSSKNPTRAVVHNAKWVKGKSSNTFLNNLARRMDKQFRNPGIIMKGLKGFDKLAGTLKMGKLGLGFSKANSFPQWTRNVVAGVEKGRYGMKISAIPKMIGKKLFPINVGLNVIDEGIKTISKAKAGTLSGTDLAVSASNVVIKSASAGVGAVAGGALLGTVGGPVGAAVGAYVGGAVGSFVGGKIAGVAEKGIKWIGGLFN
ncbi:WXG100 family type VII secretion target [Paenibacillus urinalis]|uniref:WXG100 family type VII secretion target n=1 Tax=Paenibacillus urinalis TaxID=521520 RepID=A0AAX3N1Y5_9BACL|nr:WXG100 family type VII secretion target [Paenibacillus urinalis]WDH83741.1 WXG100 family type VII secretion target [Paenibacillus urinalis]